MTREQLKTIGKRIIASDGTEEEIDQLMELFDEHIPYPNGSGLFFWPENEEEADDYDPSVEDVVDKCLGYKPTQL